MRQPMRIASYCVLALLALGTAFQVRAGAQAETSDRPITEIEGKSLDQWIKDLTNPDPATRVYAIQAIKSFGPAAQAAGAALTNRLLDKDASVRLNAVIALGANGVKAHDMDRTVTALAQRLTDDGQAEIRLQAAQALYNFGPDAKGAIPQLVSKVNDLATFAIRKTTVRALSRAAADSNNGPDMRAINAILYVLKYDPSAQVRQEAAMALGELGRPATLPDYQKEKSYLLQALHDPEKTVVIWSYVAMLVIDSTVTEEHLVAIAGLLKPKGNKPIVRLHATRALAAL